MLLSSLSGDKTLEVGKRRQLQQLKMKQELEYVSMLLLVC